MRLKQLGWTDDFERSYRSLGGDPELSPARVTRRNRSDYRLEGEEGPRQAALAGRLLQEPESLPVVGDWVVVRQLPERGRATIHGLLPRRGGFSRRGVGPGGRSAKHGQLREQTVAANVDVAFLVSGLDGGRNFNLGRLERYLTLAWDSGADPVVVLNKADLCRDPAEYVESAEAVAIGVPILLASAVSGAGISEIAGLLPTGRTGVFLGPSGVGKSTLINGLLGADELATQTSRGGDLRGRHTTTWSEIMMVPGGGLVIDTPGMRDVQLWASEESLEQTFAEVEELAQDCKYRDCSHGADDGCAIQAALADGSLSRERYESYLKQRREVEYISRQQDQGEARAHRSRERKLSKLYRKYKNKD